MATEHKKHNTKKSKTSKKLERQKNPSSNNKHEKSNSWNSAKATDNHNKNKKKFKRGAPPPSAASSSSSPPSSNLVIPFPSQQYEWPRDDFLRETPPHEQAFQAALETSYLGLVVDDPATVKQHVEMATSGEKNFDLQQTLQQMQRHQFFQTDVTQPFGLGSKCAKTYVTRCLVGDHGTTYRYLGLRMFAHRWDTLTKGTSGNANHTMIGCTNTHNNAETVVQRKLSHDIQVFKDQVLVPRTKHHLHELHQQRKQLGQPDYNVTRSNPNYNICLINRMDSAVADDYKWEPSLQQSKIAVAWHADSSLEHYSNIAVYQWIVKEVKDDEEKNTSPKIKDEKEDAGTDSGWALAMRTTPNAEGPNIQADHQADPNIPPISVSLPSGSTYYMLDDFNHHHQHAVLYKPPKSSKESMASTSNPSNDDDSHRHKHKKQKKQPSTSTSTLSSASPSPQEATPTIRYSATYRQLRPSHTVHELLVQCATTCHPSHFQKRGVKVWRPEQVLLFAMEAEWLRQFYIQGQHHYNMLWNNNWDAPLTQLWKYWSALEERTRHVLELLQLAAMFAATNHTMDNGTTHNTNNTAKRNKKERKLRDKQRKAHHAVQTLLERRQGSTDEQPLALEILYQPMADLIRERSVMRAQWEKREKDHVFTTMDPKYRPLPWPVQHTPLATYSGGAVAALDGGAAMNDTTIMATSTMPGSPKELETIATQLEQFGRAFDSGKANDLPQQPILLLAKHPPQASSGSAAADGTGSTASATTTTIADAASSNADSSSLQHHPPTKDRRQKGIQKHKHGSNHHSNHGKNHGSKKDDNPRKKKKLRY